MWNKIGIYLPTYKRSTTKLPIHLQSVFDTVSNLENIYYIFVVNELDEETTKFLKNYMKDKCTYEIIFEKLKAPHLAKFFNMAYYKAKNQSENMLASMIGDDMIFETKNWDKILLNVVNQLNGEGIFYCAGDERLNAGLCVNLFLTRKFVNICECQFMCEEFPANGIDMIWQMVADVTGLGVYIQDIIIKHQQCSRADVGWDETFTRLKSSRDEAIAKAKLEIIEADKIINTLIKHGFSRKRETSQSLRYMLDDRYYVIDGIVEKGFK
jgi:hypothetical protein